MTSRQTVAHRLTAGILDSAADRALATRHAEAWYVATVLATAATLWALLTIARALTAATKETP